MEQLAGLHHMMNDFADRLDRLNQLFPDLATPVTLDGVSMWQETKKRADEKVEAGSSGQPDAQVEIPQQELVQPPVEEPIDLRKACLELLQNNGLEDVQDILSQERGIDLPMHELVDTIGKELYIAVLKRDVKQLSENAISYDQIANLWNELGRPALSGPTWSGRSISVLIG